MKEFEKYILDNHPDPDSVLIDNLQRWGQIVLLAEDYAKSKVKSNLHIVNHRRELLIDFNEKLSIKHHWFMPADIESIDNYISNL